MAGSIASNIVWEIPRDCWPTPQQELLLKASLLGGEEAVKAWREWRRVQDIEAVDYGSFRLLPLAYKNLIRLGIDDAELKRLKGIYRQSWVRNQLLFNEGVKLLKGFEQAGIKTVVLKGAALSLKYYQDAGTRPMADFDFMVPPDKARQATAYLIDEGWEPRTRLSSDIQLYHGCNFAHKNGLEVDLHWHLLDESCFSGGDDPFWKEAAPLEIQNISTLTLDPADHLLHACVHGLRWNATPPIRWIADAYIIIETSGNNLDWDRILQHAKDYGLVSCLAAGLSYIRTLLNCEIPEFVIRGLKDMPVTRMDRVTFKARTRNLNVVSPIPAVWNHYTRHTRMTSEMGTLRRLLRFPGYLQVLWGLESIWHVPYYFITKGFVRIVRITKSKLGMQSQHFG